MVALNDEFLMQLETASEGEIWVMAFGILSKLMPGRNSVNFYLLFAPNPDVSPVNLQVNIFEKKLETASPTVAKEKNKAGNKPAD